MDCGMYSALSGNLSALRRLDVIANNLANVSTPGYKADRLDFEAVLADAGGTGSDPTQTTTQVVIVDHFFTDYSAGPMQKTDNTLDVALDGDGFFVVNTPDGTAYTRQGNFHRDASGKLVTASGYEVQGKNGPITLHGGRINISPTGVVTVDGVTAGTLEQVDFPKPYALSKAGGGLFVPSDPAAAPTPTPASAQVKQGFLEASNVKVITEMARMIETNRYFESCVRAVQTYDALAAKAATTLGTV